MPLLRNRKLGESIELECRVFVLLCYSLAATHAAATKTKPTRAGGNVLHKKQVSSAAHKDGQSKNCVEVCPEAAEGGEHASRARGVI